MFDYFFDNLVCNVDDGDPMQASDWELKQANL